MAGPSSLTHHEFLVVEGYRISEGAEALAGKADTDSIELAMARRLIDERGRAATRCLVTSGGRVLSHPLADDIAGDYDARTGAAVVSRRWSQTAYGLDEAADHVWGSLIQLVFTPGSGWTNIVKEAEPQLFTATTNQAFADGAALAMRAAVNSAACVTLSPDAKRVALVDSRGPGRSDDCRLWLWEEHLDSGDRRLLTGFPELGFGNLSYSADGRWLLLQADSEGSRLVSIPEQRVVTLPKRYSSVAWHPAAGTSAVLTVEHEPPNLRLGTIDLATGQRDELGVVRPIGDAPFELWQADVSQDGRFLVGVTLAGWPEERTRTHGTVPHAVVIDLQRLTTDIPFPLEFGIPGIERGHSYPRWLRDAQPATDIRIADELLAGAEPCYRPQPEAAEEQELTERFITLQLAHLRAGEQPGREFLLTDALRYTEAALDGAGHDQGPVARRGAMAAERLGLQETARRWHRVAAESGFGDVVEAGEPPVRRSLPPDANLPLTQRFATPSDRAAELRRPPATAEASPVSVGLFAVLAGIALLVTLYLSVRIQRLFLGWFGDPGLVGVLLGLLFWTAVPWLITYRLARAALRRSPWSGRRWTLLWALIAFAILVELALAAVRW